MTFAAEKSVLIHFNKNRRQWANPVTLYQPTGAGYSIVKPIPSGRFLGVWLDWKLSWKAHCTAVEKKLRTQDFALSRIATKTWGPSLPTAREVYIKCIRSAIANGASSFHTPTTTGGRPKGIVLSLAKAQNRSLRIVARAYKATPIRHLETETYTPPLDLYLNQRLANFEERLQQKVLDAGQGPGGPRKTAGSIVAEACNRVFGRFRKRRKGPGQAPRQGPQGPTAVEAARATIHHWASQGQNQGQKRKKQNAIEALEWAWKERWNQDLQGRPTGRLADRTPPPYLFTGRSLEKHQGLTKA